GWLLRIAVARGWLLRIAVARRWLLRIAVARRWLLRVAISRRGLLRIAVSLGRLLRGGLARQEALRRPRLLRDGRHCDCGLRIVGELRKRRRVFGEEFLEIGDALLVFGMIRQPLRRVRLAARAHALEKPHHAPRVVTGLRAVVRTGGVGLTLDF